MPTILRRQLKWRGGKTICNRTAPTHISGTKRAGADAMTDKPIRIPGPDHPITIAPSPERVVVKVAGRVVADTEKALMLRESSYPGVVYIPREDVDMTLLARTDHATYCPYKGECAYYSIPIGGAQSANAVWTYEAPYAAVAAIKDHLAFYPDRVDSIEARGD
jgi:uncharacterized protein (DUF427 family)